MNKLFNWIQYIIDDYKKQKFIRKRIREIKSILNTMNECGSMREKFLLIQQVGMAIAALKVAAAQPVPNKNKAVKGGVLCGENIIPGKERVIPLDRQSDFIEKILEICESSGNIVSAKLDGKEIFNATKESERDGKSNNSD